MSILNAKHMADTLFTTRHDFHMKNIIDSAEDAYQNLLTQVKGPEAFEISLMKTVPADVIDELRADGFIIEETESTFVMKLPEGGIITATEAEVVTTEDSDVTGTVPSGSTDVPYIESHEDHSDDAD